MKYIVLRGVKRQVEEYHTRMFHGYKVRVDACPSCEVLGPIRATRGEGGDLYCCCGGFHLGPVVSA